MSILNSLPVVSRPIAVIGCGTLGQRIALMFASGGGEVRLYDANSEQAQAALHFVRAQLPAVVTARPGASAGKTIIAGSLPEAVAGVWMAVEAVPERLELKKAVFADLDRLAPQDAILASNSSSFPSSQFIDRVSRPERVVNTHFYMPPEQRVVEVMSCGKTDEAIIECVMSRLPTFGLLPFHVLKESVGFIFNRVWAALKRECLAVVAEGVSTPQEVDRIAQAVFGSPVGPFRGMDQVGLDVALDIEEHYVATRPDLPTGPRELLRQYVAEGRLGVKTGRGFYDYP